MKQPAAPARRRYASIALLAVLLAPAAAGAAAPLRYDKVAFEHAVLARGPVIVHFAAGWCPTCQVQKPIVQQLLQEPALRQVKLFVADYDRERLLRGALGVNQQSTFVVFRNGFEVGRSTGQTSRDDIRTTFAKALPRNEWLDPAPGASGRPGAAAPRTERGPAAETPFTPFSLKDARP